MKKAVQAKKEKNQRGEDQDRPVEGKNTWEGASAEKSKHGTEKSAGVGRDEGLGGTPDEGAEKEKKEEAAEELSDEEKPATEETRATELKDRYLRLSAEFDNYKKRMMREKTDRLKYSNMEFIKDLLPSLDNLERAIAHASDKEIETGSMLEGLEMVYKGLQEIFSNYGVTRIESLGMEFDPSRHQAVGMVESNETPDNHVAEECLTGYFLHDRIIRPTMVRVSGKE